MKNGTLKPEIETMICAAKEQAIQTKWIKGNIDKSKGQTKYRTCSRADKTVNHIVSECPIIFWEFAIQTDKEIEHRRPDIVVIVKRRENAKSSK